MSSRAMTFRGGSWTVVGFGSSALSALTGLLFGAFYEWTNDVYFVAMLYWLGNTWPLVVDWTAWSRTALFAFWVGAAVVSLARRQATGTGRAVRPERPSSTSDGGRLGRRSQLSHLWD